MDNHLSFVCLILTQLANILCAGLDVLEYAGWSNVGDAHCAPADLYLYCYRLYLVLRSEQLCWTVPPCHPELGATNPVLENRGPAIQSQYFDLFDLAPVRLQLT